ncbi:MAG: class I SAM-dependent methyltransferase [Xanthomonadales bacterium]|nr:methyltransferase [Gammaproteobacteria bacterium]MBT8052525.1 methyltransferase [Gammaproteobacteria bacterium]NND57101.1 class I SAM-dependent methyltransferase [Xanthomonadales bacterium]NNK52751.1 class I SAM-dependent methyltransferase [Xanthomonadales bacterium]
MTRVLMILLLLVSAFAHASDFSSVETKLEAAMNADVRSEAEKDRDRNRRPVDTLEFFGLRDDMKVVELLPGGGWYTKLLAPVLAENGELYVALGTGRVEERLLNQEGFDKVKVTAKEARVFRPEGSRTYALEIDGLGVEDADIVFTFRNYHNFGPEGRTAMNRAVFDALKPGGVYAVVDHTRRHMEADNDENRRRMDPLRAILEIEAAGFDFVDFSDLHFRPDDELRYEVGRKTVTGNTDRWTLKFVKPTD